jgi:hypothetical protein
MKPKHLFTSMLAVTALFVASCSTSRLGQNSTVQDDVYNTTVQAREYREVASQQVMAQNGVDSTGQVDDYYGTSDPYYDMDYSTRINRFYYANPWRNYYDGYYGYNSYLFNPYFDLYSTSFVFGGINNWISPFSYWGFYGAPYYHNFWGPYSYSNRFYGGFYGGGFYTPVAGGYYGSVGNRGTRNPNYGPRPTRGSENGINRGNGAGYNGNANGIIDRTASSSRAERYNPTNGSAGNTRTNGNATSTARPTRSNESRPGRSNDTPPARTYSPPQQSAPPPASSSSRGESSSSSGSSSSNGGRPGRGN